MSHFPNVEVLFALLFIKTNNINKETNKQHWPWPFTPSSIFHSRSHLLSWWGEDRVLSGHSNNTCWSVTLCVDSVQSLCGQGAIPNEADLHRRGYHFVLNLCKGWVKILYQTRRGRVFCPKSWMALWIWPFAFISGRAHGYLHIALAKWDLITKKFQCRLVCQWHLATWHFDGITQYRL